VPLVGGQKLIRINLSLLEKKIARLKRRSMATYLKHTVHEMVEPVRAPKPLVVVKADGQSRPPEVAPALGEHTRPHRIMRRHERQNVMEDALREVADAIHLVRCRCLFLVLGPLVRGHSVEQVVCVHAVRNH
jgi:hypothetical protein